MVRILGSHCCGLGTTPGQGMEIPQAVQHDQKKKKTSPVLVLKLMLIVINSNYTRSRPRKTKHI